MTKRLHIILSFLFAVVIAVSALVFPTSIPLASAAETVVGAYEEQNVMYDLEGSTIGDRAFSLTDYPLNVTAPPQVIHFAEFGYSYDADRRSDFGLYLYVYNPQQIALDTASQRNKVQLSFGTRDSYSKYTLEFLNYSEGAGIEGRFYKFKVSLTDAAKQFVFNNVSPDARVYRISGIELSRGGVVTEYPCTQVYTYTGYAKGYGSELAEGDTLSCTADGLEKFLSLEVHSTYYRPEGTNGQNRYTHDSLSSIYFAIPRDVVEEYGRMSRIRGEYIRALTSEIFVTGDEAFYREFLSVVGQDVGYVDEDDAFRGMILANEGRTIVGISSDWMYHAPQEIAEYYTDDRYFSQLNYVLRATTGNADTFDLPSETLQAYMEWFTEEYAADNDTLVAGRYAEALFEEYDTSPTVFDLTADSVTPDLTSLEISRTFWQALLGQETVSSTLYNGKEAIHEVTEDDFVLNSGTSIINAEATCEELLIAEADYDEFRAFYEQNSADSVIYLVRFAVDDYASTEAMQCHFSEVGHKFGSNEPILVYEEDGANTNCYLAQQYVYLDFDVIDITCAKDGTETVLPVVSSPIDIIPDIDSPAYTTDDKPDMDWLKWLFAALALIIVLIILAPLLPYVFKFLLWLLMLPAKFVVWIINLFKRKNE